MKGTKYLFLAATALSFAACSSDDENMGANDGPVAAQITAGINDVLTRAFGQSWEANDAIGVSVYTPTDEHPRSPNTPTCTMLPPLATATSRTLAARHQASSSKMRTKRYISALTILLMKTVKKTTEK